MEDMEEIKCSMDHTHMKGFIWVFIEKGAWLLFGSTIIVVWLITSLNDCSLMGLIKDLELM